MTIQEYSQQLQDRLSTGRSNHDLTDLAAISKNLSDVQDILSDLKQYVRRYTFSSVDEEIAFFKEIKPVFISQLVYYKLLLKMQLHRSYGNESDINVFCEAYLKKFKRYLLKHESFFLYCVSGSTYQDRLYFTREYAMRLRINDDENFTTGFDRKLGRFLAYQLARDYIQSLLRKDENGGLPPAPELNWTESKASLIELAYALYASRALDDGKVSIKQIIGIIEQLTGLDLSNYRRIFADIRIRKTGPTGFLDLLSRQYKQYVDSLN
jgi:hypothetical protein